MIDYRLKENRLPYFKRLYNLNLMYNVHPGLVYLYMPELKKHHNWDDETALWFATINGHTQNPITSMRLFEVMPTGEGAFIVDFGTTVRDRTADFC
jgi:hypothetical protein